MMPRRLRRGLLSEPTPAARYWQRWFEGQDRKMRPDAWRKSGTRRYA